MKSKTRRKLTFRRFAYYLLIAAIVVSCVANGIFAKFTTEDDGGDGARVAKFGLKLSVAGDLFSTTYNQLGYQLDTNGDPVEDAEGNPVVLENSNLPAAWVETISDDDTISVQATAKYVLADGTETDAPSENATYSFNNVVAPGTKNDTGICIDIQGTAETDCEILYDIFYKPIYLNRHNAYGLMVEIKKELITEANWEEMVAEGLYYVSKTESSYKEYKAVETTDTYAAKYKSTPNFFKLTNKVEVDDNVNKEIDYYYPTILKIKKVENGIEKEFSSKDLTPSQFLSSMTSLGSLMGGGEDLFHVTYPEEADASTGRIVTDSSDPEMISTNTSIDKQYYFTWEWEYQYNETQESHFSKEQAHAYDTILGYIAAGEEVVKYVTADKVYTSNLVTGIEEGTKDDYNLNFDVTANVTINQVD